MVGRTRARHLEKIGVQWVVDILLVVLAFAVGSAIRFGVDAPEFFIDRWLGFLIGGGAFACSLYTLGVYNGRGLSTSRVGLVMAYCISAVVCVVAILLYGGVDFSARVGRGIMLISLGVLAVTVFVRKLTGRATSVIGRRRVAMLVFSADDLKDARLVQHNENQRVRFVGVVAGRGTDEAAFTFDHRIPVLGGEGDLRDIVERNGITTLVLPRKLPSCDDLGSRLRSAFYTGSEVQSFCDFCENLDHAVPLELVDSEWLMRATTAPGNGYILRFKRVVDIVVSLLLGVFLLPLMALAMAAIRLTMGPGVFFKQVRVGRFGREFSILKLRSMLHDTEMNEEGTKAKAKWATETDPRITPVGNFIRKYRLDEIPQLWNVLRGEMSLVGPRPEQPEMVEILADEIPHYRERLMVSPGLTGWAQVNLSYVNTIEDSWKKLEYDLFYLKHIGMRFDFFILLDTVRTVVFGGAGSEAPETKTALVRAMPDEQLASEAATADQVAVGAER